MVRWYDPAELGATAIRFVLSSIFGQYADKREAERALPARVAAFLQDGIWIDYVSDVGDAFGPTYSVASAR